MCETFELADQKWTMSNSAGVIINMINPKLLREVAYS